MKFRCERDVLVEALATATRAVASRGGALPVLSGVKIDLRGDQLQLAGSDLDLTIQVEVTVSGQIDRNDAIGGVIGVTEGLRMMNGRITVSREFIEIGEDVSARKWNAAGGRKITQAAAEFLELFPRRRIVVRGLDECAVQVIETLSSDEPGTQVHARQLAVC